jgi:hypothetical protein
VIEGYADTTFKKTINTTYSLAIDSAQIRTYQSSVIHDTDTAAITTVKITTDAADDFIGDLSLWVEKEGILPVVGGGAASQEINTQILLAELDVVSDEFDFTGLDFSGYDRLVVKGQFTGTEAQTSAWVYCYINGDFTAANYHTQSYYGVNGSESNVEYASTPGIGFVPGTLAPTGRKGTLEVIIENPAAAGPHQLIGNFSYTRNTGEVGGGSMFVDAADTNAITRLTFRTDNHPTDLFTGKLSVYGEKVVSVAGAGPDLTGRVVTERLQTITQATGGNFDFQNIPSGYKRLWIRGYIGAKSAVTSDNLNIFFNGDTTLANYASQYAIDGENNASSYIGACSGASADSVYSEIEIVMDHTDVDVAGLENRVLCTMDRRESATQYRIQEARVIHDSQTAVITQLTVEIQGKPTEAIGSLTLYGERTL